MQFRLSVTARLLLLLGPVLFAAQTQAMHRDKLLKHGEWGSWLKAASEASKRRNDRSLHRARILYECLARYDSTPHGIEARYRLACLYIHPQSGLNHLRAGVDLLTDLTTRFDHEPSHKELAKLRTRWLPQKEAALREAQDALERRRYDLAIHHACRALRLPFKLRGEVGETVSSDEVLGIMVRARLGLESSARFRTGPCQCKTCSAEGFVKCSKCKGKGRIRGLTRLPGGGREVRTGRCPKCRGLGKIPCRSCGSSGIDTATLTRWERKSLLLFLKRIQACHKMKKLRDALRLAVGTALAVQLRLPPGLRPKDVETVRLAAWDGKSRLPLDFQQKWGEGDKVLRNRLIMDAIIVTVRAAGCAPYFCKAPRIESRKAQKPDADVNPLLSPVFVSAFPQRLTGIVISLDATVGEVQPSALFPGMKEIVIRNGDARALTVLAWNSQGARAIRNLASYLSPRSWLRDYRGIKELEGLPELKPGNRVVLTGRLWHAGRWEGTAWIHESTWPTTLFEVWSIDTGDSARPDESADVQKMGGDAPTYLARQPTQLRLKSLARKSAAENFRASAYHLGQARALGLARVQDAGWKTLWAMAEPLEAARDRLRILTKSAPADAFADELFTSTQLKLLQIYREIARK